MKLDNFKLEYNPAETKEFGVTDYMLDALSGVPAGLEDMAHGAYNLGDFLAFDTLPNWDEERFFARPKTLAGDLSAGIVQYALPFGFIGKGLSKAGKLTKALTKGKKPGAFTDLNVKGYLAADVATNFVAFDGQQERLSNLLKEIDNPALNNAVTQYLAADPDDSELEGRMKNVLEGAMIDAGVGALFKLFSSGLKASKRYVKELDAGANKEDAVVSATFDYQDGVAAYSDLPDFNQNGPKYVEEFRESVIDEWDYHLPEDALSDVVSGAIDDFPKPYRNFLRALEKEDWLGFDYPSQAVNEIITNPHVYDDFEITPALKSAITKFENAAFEGKAFSDMPDLRAKLRSNPDLVDNFEEAIALVDDDLGRVKPRPFRTYPDEGLEAFQPKGAKVLKDRLVKKFALGDDIAGAEEVEKFIDVLGKRMFSDVGISVTTRLKPQGRYQWATNVVQLRRDVVESGGLKRTAIHELWHSLSRYLPEGDLDRLTKEFNRERNKYIKSFGVEIKNLDDAFDTSTLSFKEMPEELRSFLMDEGFSEHNYRFRDIDEYFAELMTDEFLTRSAKGEFDRGADRTFRGIARDIAIILKDLFASIQSKFGISQQRKIFNDFLSQRNVTKQRYGALGDNNLFLRRFSDMPEFNKTVDSFLEQATAKGVRIGGKAAVKGVVKDLVKLTDGMTTGELAALQDAIADKLLEEGTAIKTLTKESLEEGGLAEFADLVGADGTVLDQFVEQAAKDTVTLNRVMSRMAAMQELMEANGQEIIKIAKQYSDAKFSFVNKEGSISLDEAARMEARLKGLVEQQLHIQAGHSSLASGFGRGLKSRQMRTQMSLSTDELQNKQIREEFLSKKGGMTMDQLVEGILIAEKNGGGDLFNTLIGVNKQIRGGHGGKMMDMVQEYYKNSLMWGPRTLTINALGTGLSNVWKNFERSIGGWVGADEATRRAVANQWGETTSFMDAWKFLLNAWETGDQFIGDAGSAFVENSKSSIGSITGDNVQKVLRNVEISDGMKEAIDMFGNIIRFPNRFNTSVDQFYKFVQYKGRALSELKLKAYDLGIRDPEKVAEYVHDTFEALVTRSNRNFSEGALFKEAQEVFKDQKFETPAERQKAIADYVRTEKTNKLNKAREAGLIEGSLDDDTALRELTKNWIDPNIKVAEEVTFSGQLGDVGQKVQNLVTAMPGGFLIAPFVRTPTNILKFSYDRISAPARAVIDRARASDAWAKLEPEYRQRIDALRDGLKGSEEYRKTILEQLNARKPDGSPDRIARAEARGKVAMGTALNASLFYAIHNFADNITGGGPSDYKQKQAWLASGKLPYSIKFGDTWVSYQRLDPLATVIGIYADYKDLSEDNKIAAANSDDLDKLMAVTFELGVRNVTDKSYLAGVNKILKMLAGEGTPGKVLGGVAGGFIPNIIPQGASIAGDQHMKEARGFADVVLKRIPGLDIDLKRNPLGEPVVIQQFEGAARILNPLNPLAWGFDKDDKVAKELANVAHGFSPPSNKIAGVIELTDFIGANGRSAYDRMLDLQSKVVLNGMTQRQALTKLINDKRYRSLDPTSFVGLPSERVKYINRILSRYKKAAQNQMLREFPEILQMKEQVEGSVRSGASREDVLALLTQ